MSPISFDALSERLSAHIDLSKSRMETLILLIVGMIGSRTVNLSHVASERGSSAKVASTYRRLQRFFQYVRPGEDWAARLIVSLLGLTGQRILCLDRTNWKLGKKDINILVLAVVTDRHRVPLMWTFLDGPGSSSTVQRVELIQRYLEIFGASSIKHLLADREFIGAQWMNYLNENNVPFVIRVKKDMCVILEDGRRFALASLLRKTKKEPAYSRRTRPAGQAGASAAHLCRQKDWQGRLAHRRRQHGRSSCAQGVSPTLVHRVPVRGCQNAWTEYGRHRDH